MRHHIAAVLIALSLASAASAAVPLNLPQDPGYVPPSYWSQFPATKGKWDRPDFYLVGVWAQNVTQASEAAIDKAMGINTYVATTGYTNPAIIRAAGMYAIRQWEVTDQTPLGVYSGYGAETVGWLIEDEADMKYGPGSSGWDGIYYDAASGYSHCVPKTSTCGYTVIQKTKAKFPQGPGRFFAANYGKGVLFWQSDAQARVWFNSGYQDLSGVDTYWHNDKDACVSTQGGRLARQGLLKATGAPDPYGDGAPTLTAEECYRSSNFAAAQARARALDGADGKYQPLWCFVHVGGVTPAQMQGEVAACLISGSYPIYFNHVFDAGPPTPGLGQGPCITQSALRDACYSGHRQAATAINAFIAANAAMLNSPRLKWDFGAAKLLTRLSQAPDGSVWVMALQKEGTSGSFSLTLPAGAWTSAEETCSTPLKTRTIAVAAGKLAVNFAAESDWCAWKLFEGSTPPPPPAVPPSDPVVSIKQSRIDALKAAVDALTRP